VSNLHRKYDPSNLGRMGEEETVADTIDVLQGTYNAAANAVIGFLPVQSFKRRISNITVMGPARSTFRMYRGDRISPALQMTSTPTGGGENNTYDSITTGAPTFIGPGEQAIGVWTGGLVAAGQTGTATVRSVY